MNRPGSIGSFGVESSGLSIASAEVASGVQAYASARTGAEKLKARARLASAGITGRGMDNLMSELEKVKRVVERTPDVLREVLLVLDATTGQNAFSQLQLFHEAVGLTGLVLTKLDGTARGGVVLGLAREFPVPVKLVGIGEPVEDLQEFDRAAFVEALYAPG